jgi:hypothetical protein
MIPERAHEIPGVAAVVRAEEAARARPAPRAAGLARTAGLEGPGGVGHPGSGLELVGVLVRGAFGAGRVVKLTRGRTPSDPPNGGRLHAMVVGRPVQPPPSAAPRAGALEVP